MCRRGGPLPQLQAGFCGQVLGRPVCAIEQLSLAASNGQSYQFLPLMSMSLGNFMFEALCWVFLSHALEPLNSKPPGSESESIHGSGCFHCYCRQARPLPRWESALILLRHLLLAF